MTRALYGGGTVGIGRWLMRPILLLWGGGHRSSTTRPLRRHVRRYANIGLDRATPRREGYAVRGTAFEIAHMKAMRSRAIAMTATFGG